MTQFHRRGWDARYAEMGDEAEGVFETLNSNCTRYGLDRPKVNLAKVPRFIRYTPDYLMHDRLVEVMGFGKDQLIKLKLEKLEQLLAWSEHYPVHLFLWDSHKERWAELEIGAVRQAAYLAPVKLFPEGTPYYEIPADGLSALWHRMTIDSIVA
jgi:hypothetical protein